MSQNPKIVPHCPVFMGLCDGACKPWYFPPGQVSVKPTNAVSCFPKGMSRDTRYIAIPQGTLLLIDACLASLLHGLVKYFFIEWPFFHYCWFINS
jgi:hypothetical protein